MLNSVENSNSNGKSNEDVTIVHLFEKIMERSLNCVHKFSETFIQSAVHDVLGLLLCVQLLHAFLRLAKERDLMVLDKYALKNMLFCIKLCFCLFIRFIYLSIYLSIIHVVIIFFQGFGID